MTKKQVEDLLDGVALLECLGNLYEYVGMDQGKYIFQSISSDQFIRSSYKNLFTMPEYCIQY